MYTLQEYNNLKSQYVKGILNVQNPTGGSVTFRSKREMKEIIDEMEAFLIESGELTKTKTGRSTYIRINGAR